MGQLQIVWASHGLSRGELMAAQRAIRRLDQLGQAPSADAYFATTARPRAQLLVREARAAIDVHLPCWAGQVRRPAGPASLTLAIPSRAGIDELGRWWQRRLRRAAVVRALPRLVGQLPADLERTIAHYEMALLDRPPWSHGDRLLSAFEQAHGEIGRYSQRRLAELGQQPRPTPAPVLATG